MDFKIGDEIEETEESQKKSSSDSKLPLIIIVVVSILVGLTVFFITNKLFGPKEVKEEPVVATNLSLSEENVQILYAYVTYGTSEKRNDKFVKESHVTLDSFTNQEKFYYALQFAQVEDFEATGKLDDNNKKIYNISDMVIRNYMQRFFGNKVTYTYDVNLTYPFTFSINGQNIGILTASKNSDGLDAIFEGNDKELSEGEEEIVEPYYGELVAAYKEPDGTYRLEEKVVYTRTEKKDDTYTIYIYKDYAKTQLIETKLNQTKETLEATPIDMKNYKEKASTITYHFGLYNNMLYFESSDISNE